MHTGIEGSSHKNPSKETDDLAEAVLTASRVLVAVAARSLAEEEAVSLPQYRALVVLASRGPQRPVDLAEALDVDPSTATRMCDRLEGKGLITRRRDEGEDRRVVVLNASTSGRRLVDRVTRRRRSEIGKIVGAVEPKERPNLVRAFNVFGKAAGEIPEGDWERSWEL